MKSIALVSVSLLFVVSFQGVNAFNSQPADAPDKNPASISLDRQRQEDRQEGKKRSFEIAGNLLRRTGVPFDPEVLLQDRWEETLAPVFAQMPEMQEVRYSEAKGGVELADTLYLPEKVAVSDDLVIIARHLVFEGNNVVIKGHHHISILPAEDVTVMGDNLPRRLHKKNGKQTVTVEIPESRPPVRGGNITVDTSGIGYKDWLESIGGESRLNKVIKALYHRDKRIRDAALREFESLRTGKSPEQISPQDETRDTSGQWGAIGLPGATGPAPDDPNPLVQPQNTGGVCGGNINGLAGIGGAFGGDAGVAGTGNRGTDGSAGTGGAYTIPDGDNNAWHFISRGGTGGKGGPGGYAYDGKKGGTGGQGGDGASCNCAQGGAGNGGKGGRGGLGGRAGGGGKGGKGGDGKRGGDITVDAPCRSKWSGSYDGAVDGGDRGTGSNGFSAGSLGQAGNPGHQGRGELQVLGRGRGLGPVTSWPYIQK